ncbi:MAG: hypothetical protein AAB400_00755 [Patescibacteria group bacterium]
MTHSSTGPEKSSSPPFSVERYLVAPVEKFPECEITFFFGVHHEVGDLEFIKRRFHECDIFLPEWEGWGPAMIEGFNALSRGTIRSIEFNKLHIAPPSDPHEFSYLLGMLEMIHGSKKVIGFYDTPYNHKIKQDSKKLYTIESNDTFRILTSLKSNSPASFRKEVERFQRLEIKLFETIGLRREAYMLQRLPKTLQVCIDTHPHLASKHPLKAFSSLGAAHGRFADVVKKYHNTVSAQYPDNWDGDITVGMSTFLRDGKGDSAPWSVLYLVSLLKRGFGNVSKLDTGTAMSLDSILFREFIHKTPEELEAFYYTQLPVFLQNPGTFKIFFLSLLKKYQEISAHQGQRDGSESASN